MHEWSVPKAFIDRRVALSGDDGREWIESLPATVESLCVQWNLEIEGAPMHGEKGLVFPVSGERALKVAWKEVITAAEPLVLQLWNGNGAIKLHEHDADAGAMLLERADSTRDLTTTDVDTAARVAGELIARHAIPAPEQLMRVNELHTRLEEMRAQHMHLIPSAFHDCVAPPDVRSDVIVNWDLQYANVLAAEREPWLLVDPMVVAADRELGVFMMLLRAPEPGDFGRIFRIIVETAELDEELARGYIRWRALHYWLWAIETGLTEDPKKCDEILRMFA